jgi:hypothetical protein
LKFQVQREDKSKRQEELAAKCIDAWLA